MVTPTPTSPSSGIAPAPSRKPFNTAFDLSREPAHHLAQDLSHQLALDLPRDLPQTLALKVYQIDLLPDLHPSPSSSRSSFPAFLFPIFIPHDAFETNGTTLARAKNLSLERLLEYRSEHIRSPIQAPAQSVFIKLIQVTNLKG
uniref:Uncharacterized protein n=1 Tax=Romanomermis culicivorax TaxID=13658 RepID=A0A915HH48_ROMCU